MLGMLDDLYSVYLTLSVAKTCRIMNGRMIVHNEWERMWKEIGIA
jgi:hypothetical protein